MNNIEIPTYRFALREDLKNNKEFLPTRGEPLATGWDVKAAQEDRKPIVLKYGQKIMIPLGFRAFCPEGWWFKVNPRSSTFAKKHLHSLYGVVDETYQGMVAILLQFLPERRFFEKNGDLIDNTLTINFGEALGQIIPVKRQEMIVAEVSNEEYDNLCKERGGIRGAGGFGSTDNKTSKQLEFSYGQHPTINFTETTIQGNKF